MSPSERWCNPRAKLLQGAGWESVRSQVCRTLNLAPTAESELGALAKQLDQTYHRVSANLSTNLDVRIERVNGKDRLSLTGLDKLDEPPSLLTLRDRVNGLLPRVDLTDAILEIHGYTGFAAEFTHISESNARQRLAFEEGHGNEGLAFDFTDLVDVAGLRQSTFLKEDP